MAIQEGIAYWANVTTPNTKYEPVYTVDLVVSDEAADDFQARGFRVKDLVVNDCLLYTSPSPRDVEESRMPSSA